MFAIGAFVLAFAILSVSVLRSVMVLPAYGFSSTIPSAIPSPTPIPDVLYSLPYPGSILPDNWLWYFKAMRDRIQYSVSTDVLKRADLALLFSDKRLGASVSLFQNKKPDMAVSVLTKGEKYLEIAMKDEAKARRVGINTDDFLVRLATASLKHREVIEEQILPLTPEDLRPEVVKAEDYSKSAYKSCRDILSAKGKESPKDPFNGQ